MSKKNYIVLFTDGSGYIEDGRDIFDDDLDSESIAAASALAKEKSSKKKKKSISANAGKGNLQFMLSNMPSKKKEVSITKIINLVIKLLLFQGS